MWPDPEERADLVTFTEEILIGKLHFCAVIAIIIFYCYEVTATGLEPRTI